MSYNDQLLDNIKKCEELLANLNDGQMYKTIRDLVQDSIADIDANWHVAKDSDLYELRIRKRAFCYLSNLEDMIKDQMENFQRQLVSTQNLSTEVPMDYDNESNVEPQEGRGTYGSE